MTLEHIPPDTPTDPLAPLAVSGGTEIDRLIVHKSFDREVLLTQASAHSTATARFGIRVLRSHSSNPEGSETVPLIAGLEVMRQLGLATGHLCAQVPLNWAFTLQRAVFSWHGPSQLFPPSDEFAAVAEVSIHDVKERKGEVSELRATSEIRRRGNLIATGSGHFRCFPPETYRILRRRKAGNVCVTDREAERQIVTEIRRSGRQMSGLLGWPRDDAFLFDHDVDHVPGMLLAKAGVVSHQLLHPTRYPTSIEIMCERFAEIAEDITVEAVDSGPHVTTTLRQSGAGIAEVVTAD